MIEGGSCTFLCMDVECPIDGCEYSGPVESVEAHISGSTSGDHSGEFGREHREELVEAAEGEARDPDTSDELEEQQEEAGEGADSEMRAAGFLPAGVAALGASTAGVAADSEGPNWALIGAVVLALLVASMLLSGSESEQQQEQQQEQQAQQQPLPGAGEGVDYSEREIAPSGSGDLG